MRRGHALLDDICDLVNILKPIQSILVDKSVFDNVGESYA